MPSEFFCLVEYFRLAHPLPAMAYTRCWVLCFRRASPDLADLLVWFVQGSLSLWKRIQVNRDSFIPTLKTRDFAGGGRISVWMAMKRNVIAELLKQFLRCMNNWFKFPSINNRSSATRRIVPNVRVYEPLRGQSANLSSYNCLKPCLRNVSA